MSKRIQGQLKRAPLPDVAVGFPRAVFRGSPIEVPTNEGLAVARKWEYREAFIFALYEEAPQFFRDLHQTVYPAYEATIDFLRSSGQGGHFVRNNDIVLTILDDSRIDSSDRIRREVLSGTVLRITWDDLQDPTPEISALCETIRSMVVSRDLWIDWFVGFLLALLAARHEDRLVDYRHAREKNPFFRMFSAGMPHEVSSWDQLTFDFHCDINWSSSMPFADLERDVLEAAKAQLQELKLRHGEFRETARKMKLVQKKRRDHVSWLVQHVILGRSYVDISGDLTTPDDETTIRKGAQSAARELGIDLRREKTGK